MRGAKFFSVFIPLLMDTSAEKLCESVQSPLALPSGRKINENSYNTSIRCSLCIDTLAGVPVAFLAARNTTPSSLFIRPIALLIIVSTRSINSLIWALLLIAIIGPGVFAGVIAIAIRSIGFCAKLLYEAIEEINESQVEAITATGASRWQVMAYGIVPQILPAFAGIAVFRWDINIRESTVLGLVGAGGIGLQLSASLNVLAWPQVALILLVILAAVVISEWVSAKVRGAII